MTRKQMRLDLHLRSPVFLHCAPRFIFRVTDIFPADNPRTSAISRNTAGGHAKWTWCAKRIHFWLGITRRSLLNPIPEANPQAEPIKARGLVMDRIASVSTSQGLVARDGFVRASKYLSSEQFLKYIGIMMLQSVGKFVHIEDVRREPLRAYTNRELRSVFIQIKQDESNAEEHTQ